MKRASGMTLIEVMVSLGIMGILFAAGYVVVEDSLRLQSKLSKDATRLIDRCNLADRLAADLRASRAVQGPTAGQWTMKLADGSLADYRVEGPWVTRTRLQSKLQFLVGTTDVAAVDGGLQLKFADTELLVR